MLKFSFSLYLGFTDFYISIFTRDTQCIVFGALLDVLFLVCLQFRVHIVIEK